MHLQVFPRTAAAASTAAETQEDEGESSGQEYESATDTEEVGDTLGEGEGDGEGDLGDAPLAELMCMEQSECDQVWIYNYSLASLCLTYHSLVIRALSAE